MLPQTKSKKPLFDITIPSLKKKVKFRPYLVAEEKILLMALEGHDLESPSDKDLVDGIKQIIANCCMDPDIDVEKLAIFDLDYIFLKLHAKSVRNLISVSYKDLEDEKIYKFEIDLDKVEMTLHEDHKNKIDVDDDVKMRLRYPTLDVAERMAHATTRAQIFEIMLENCVDKIYDKETVYTDYTEEELREFLDGLDHNAFEQIKEFFATLPSLRYIIEYINEKGTERKIELTSLRDFFTW